MANIKPKQLSDDVLSTQTTPTGGASFSAKARRIADVDDPVDPQDAATRIYTLVAIAAASTANTYDLLLDCEPPAPDNTYSNTASGNRITQEKWVRTGDSTNLKIINYTYANGKVSTEVRRVYAANGITIVAQLTLVYTYAGNLVTSIVATRDI